MFWSAEYTRFHLRAAGREGINGRESLLPSHLSERCTVHTETSKAHYAVHSSSMGLVHSHLSCWLENSKAYQKDQGRARLVTFLGQPDKKRHFKYISWISSPHPKWQILFYHRDRSCQCYHADTIMIGTQTLSWNPERAKCICFLLHTSSS